MCDFFDGPGSIDDMFAFDSTSNNEELFGDKDKEKDSFSYDFNNNSDDESDDDFF